MEKTPDENKTLLAQKHWKENGWLGVTAEDHTLKGSTPDDILIKNPGKTLGELMSDEEIHEYIAEMQKIIIKDENSDIEHIRMLAEMQKENLDSCIRYLKVIGRLTEDFNPGDMLS